MHWKEREPVYVRRRQLALEDFDGHVPAYAPGTFGDEGEGEVVSTPARRTPEQRQRLGRAGRPSARPVRGNGPAAGTAVEEAPPAVEAPEPQEIEEPPVTGNGADGADGADRADGADGADERSSSSTSSTAGPNRPRPKKQQQQRRRKRHGRR
jgi:hypothetical protein